MEGDSAESPGSSLPRILHLQVESSGAVEAPEKSPVHVPHFKALLTLIYTLSHTSQQKSLWQNGSGGLNMCLFQGGIFPEKPHPPIKTPSNFFGMWFFLPQKSPLDLPYPYTVLVPAATLHPRLRHILVHIPTPGSQK